MKLDFVDTSNIADTDYVGIAPLLQRWGPLLNKAANPESTLLTGFMNWFMEVPGAKNECKLAAIGMIRMTFHL